MDMRTVGPPPLEAKVTKRLLDLLSTDDQFRELFVRDANAALVVAGYTSLEGTTTAGPGDCMQMGPADRLASKEQIMRDRAKLESDLLSLFHFDCPARLLAP